MVINAFSFWYTTVKQYTLTFLENHYDSTHFYKTHKDDSFFHTSTCTNILTKARQLSITTHVKISITKYNKQYHFKLCEDFNKICKCKLLFRFLLASNSVSNALILCEIASKVQIDFVAIFCITFPIWHLKDGSNFRGTGSWKCNLKARVVTD